ncbi:MAG: SpoIIE family protein phosphatase [Bacteroidota bacterium]|nr:SpoIIE family protein phosphatase [Bacteroidota bacterium]
MQLRKLFHVFYHSVFISGILLLLFFSTNLFSQQNSRTHSLLSGKKEVNVKAIINDPNGSIWIGTDQGLVLFNGISYKIFREADGIASNSITALALSKDSTLWIGHANGKISSGKNLSFKSFLQKDSTDNTAINSILCDHSASVWFGTNGSGVYKLSGNTITKFNSENGLGDDYIYTLFEDVKGKIWMGTDAGITILKNEANIKKENFSYLSTRNGLPDNIIKKITSDKSGNIWFSTLDSGICRYDELKKLITRPLVNGGWSHGSISSMMIDHEGSFWIGTESKGLIKCSIDKNNKVQLRIIGSTNSLINEKINVLYEDNERSVWVGTPKGLTQFYRSRFEFLGKKDGLPSDSVKAFLIDSKGNYWISTTAGLSRFSFNENGKAETKNYFQLNGSSGISIVSLFEDRNGAIWLGTYGLGAFVLDPETGVYRVFSEMQGLSNNNIMSVCDDKSGNIWLSTLGGGISKISFLQPDYKGKFTVENFGEERGAGSIYVYYGYNDSKNNTWFATDGGGLTYYNGKTFQSFNSINKKIKGDVVNSITEDKKGNIWFSNQEAGVYKYDGKTFTNYNTDSGLRDLSPAIVTMGNNDDVVIVHPGGIDVLNDSESLMVRHYNVYESDKEFVPGQNAFFRDVSGNIWICTESGMVKFRASLDSLDQLAPRIQLTGMQVMLEEYPLSSEPEFDYEHNQFVFKFMGVYQTTPDRVRYRFKLEGYEKDWSPATENRIASYPSLPYGNYTFMVCAANAEGTWSKPVSYAFEITPPYYKTIWFYGLVFVLLVSSIYFYIKYSVKQLENQKRILEANVALRTKEVVEQKEIIEEKNKDITASINYARRIQEAILPDKEIKYRIFPEAFVLFQPRDIVSGDFYWFSEKNGRRLIAAVDCTGHGVPGAFMSMIGNAFLNEIVNERGIVEPHLILNELRDMIIKSLKQTGFDGQSKDGMDISILSFDDSNSLVEYSGANNPMWHIRDGVSRKIDADKQPIGYYLGNPVPFTNHKIELQKGDSVYIYTDGYADQFGGEHGKKFKYKKLLEMILSIQDKPMLEQEKILLDVFSNWQGELEQTDDVLVIGVKV